MYVWQHMAQKMLITLQGTVTSTCSKNADTNTGYGVNVLTTSTPLKEQLLTRTHVLLLEHVYNVIVQLCKRTICLDHSDTCNGIKT